MSSRGPCTRHSSWAHSSHPRSTPFQRQAPFRRVPGLRQALAGPSGGCDSALPQEASQGLCLVDVKDARTTGAPVYGVAFLEAHASVDGLG